VAFSRTATALFVDYSVRCAFSGFSGFEPNDRAFLRCGNVAGGFRIGDKCMNNSLAAGVRRYRLLAGLVLAGMSVSAGAAELRLVNKDQQQRVNGELVEDHPFFGAASGQRDHIEIVHAVSISLEPTEINPEDIATTEQTTYWLYELQPGDDGDTGERVCLSYQTMHVGQIELFGELTRASISGGGDSGSVQATADADTDTVEASTDVIEGGIRLITPYNDNRLVSAHGPVSLDSAGDFSEQRSGFFAARIGDSIEVDMGTFTASAALYPDSLDLEAASAIDIHVTGQLADCTLDVDLGVEGQGQISVSPEQEFYLWGDELTLVAIPDFGQLFLGWTGACAQVSGEVCNLDFLAENVDTTAHFGPPEIFSDQFQFE
jgi:hypothetical protein